MKTNLAYQLLEDAIQTIERLAEQQAIPDDWYEKHLNDYRWGLKRLKEKTLTREFVDILWPKHTYKGCNDTLMQNAEPCYNDGSARCNRCMALDELDNPLNEFTIEATIRLNSADISSIKAQALKKLTKEEKEALGL